jgi:hypothetical protein
MPSSAGWGVMADGDSNDALSTILAAVGQAFAPLALPDEPENAEAWLVQLGWDPERASVSLTPLFQIGGELPALIESIEALTSAESDDERLGAAIAMAASIAKVADAVRRLASADWSGAPADFRDFAAALPERLFDLLLTQMLASEFPRTYALLVLLGVIEVIDEDVAGDAGSRLPLRRDHVAWGNLGTLFSEPTRYLERAYGFGIEEGFRAAEFTLNLARALAAYGQRVRISSPGGLAAAASTDPATPLPPPLLTWPILGGGGAGGFYEVGFRFLGIPRAEGQGPTGLAIFPYAVGSAGGRAELVPEVVLDVRAELDAGTPIVLKIFPDSSSLELTNPAIAANGNARLSLAYEPSPARALLDIPGGSGIYLNSLALSGEMDLRGGAVGVEVAFDVAASLVIQGGNGDGFIQKILPSEPLTLSFELGMGYATERGFFVRGGAGLEYSIQVNQTFGPIRLDTIDLGFFVRGSEVELLTAISGGAEIGPVVANVGKVGLRTRLLLGKPGVLGDSDLDFAFKPPSSIGLSIDAGPVSGGGFVTIDPPNYSGILSLSLADTVDITAICLITTRLPDGRDGFSLLLSILAEFTPIQLGFGIALKGVGGLIGIHREMKEAELQEVVRQHSLDALLFPAAPIRDAFRIISAISSVFPPRENTHVVGPMVKLIWGGTIELVHFAIGIFIQIGDPVRIAVIGQAGAALPHEDAPLIELNIDLLGFIDFGNQTVAIDGYLFNSRVLILDLHGGMALRAGWGDNANFALSLGGFHPRFTPPPGFPELQRLGLSMDLGPVHLSLTNYLAITSNSLQFGAGVELVVGGSGFGLRGGLEFDALFIFRPFSFEVSLHAWVDLVIAGASFLAIDITGVLSGPNPFRIRGQGRFSILFFEFTVGFDESFGENQPEVAEIVSPLAVLVHELEEPRNLRFELPDWACSAVSFLPQAEGFLDPLGTVVFAQNGVPLGMNLERFGGGVPPEAERLLDLTPRDAGDVVLESTEERNAFAPEQFHDWSAAQKLSAPAFERYRAGFRLRGTLVAPEAAAMDVEIEFETVLRESQHYLDDYAPRSRRGLTACVVAGWAAGARVGLLASWARGSANSLYAPIREAAKPNGKNYVDLAEPRFSAATQTAQDGVFVADGALADTTYAHAAAAAAADGELTVRRSHRASREAS